MDKFQLYLLGKHFKLITDCKPLQFLFRERTKPNARIERWVLRLQAYSFEVVYEPGTGNIADAISRLSVSNPTDFDVVGENCIYQLVLAVIPKAVTLQEIEEETLKDEIIQQVIRNLESGTWCERTKNFKIFRTELCKFGNLLLRGDRLVVPEKLRNQILELAHESHPGMVAMKRRLRQKVWWPQMDKQVELFVKKMQSVYVGFVS